MRACLRDLPDATYHSRLMGSLLLTEPGRQYGKQECEMISGSSKQQCPRYRLEYWNGLRPNPVQALVRQHGEVSFCITLLFVFQPPAFLVF
jgi:hypothetical protein